MVKDVGVHVREPEDQQSGNAAARMNAGGPRPAVAAVAAVATIVP